MSKVENNSSFVSLSQYKKVENAYRDLSEEYKSLCAEQIFLNTQLQQAIQLNKCLMKIATIKKEQ